MDFNLLLYDCPCSHPAFQLLQLWEKNGYFDEETIQQLQNPALGLGQYQVSEIRRYALIFYSLKASSKADSFYAIFTESLFIFFATWQIWSFLNMVLCERR